MLLLHQQQQQLLREAHRAFEPARSGVGGGSGEGSSSSGGARPESSKLTVSPSFGADLHGSAGHLRGPGERGSSATGASYEEVDFQVSGKPEPKPAESMDDVFERVFLQRRPS